MKEKKGRSKSRGTLSFGLCRILVWKASAFLSSQALTLLTLHRHAGVPVLFVDIDRFSRESVFGEQKKDMHLEWNEGCNDPSGGYWFSNANDPSSVVAKRDQISEKAMRGASQYCSELLDYAQCPFRLETVKRIFERAEK